MSTNEAPISVLHVDDDAAFTALTAEYLEREDERFRFDSATSATEGLSILTKSSVDCVVSDYEMPDHNGVEFLSMVRETASDLPFILFTGKGSEEVASDAISAGVTDYLQKEVGSGHYAVLANRICNAVSAVRSQRRADDRQQRLETLVSNIPGVVYQVDNAPEWPIISIEGECEALTGYIPDRLERNEVTYGEDLIHPDDRERVWESVQQALADGTSFETEYRLVTADGKTKWIWERGRGIHDDSGMLDRLEGFQTDITDRKERQQELERTREFFRRAEQLGNLGAWEIAADDTIEWTAGTRRIHEVMAEYEPTMTEAVSFFHSADQPRLERAVEAAIVDGTEFDIEARLITAQDTERWIRTRGTPLSGDSGPVVRGYIQDITEQKHRERELEQAHSQLENAIRAGAVGTWEWDIDVDRFVLSPQFASEIGAHDAFTETGVSIDRFLSAVHPDDRDRVEREISETITEGGEYESEYRVRNVEDTYHWVLSRGQAECDTDGSATRCFGVVIDITERKRIERELKRQNDRLTEFANTIAHDLRNPLNVAQGRLTLAADDCESPELEHVAHAHDRMRTLIDDLLRLAREGEAVEELEPIDLGQLVKACWSTVETGTVQIEITQTATILGAENRLKQLFENLFRNAIDHGGDDLTVRVGILADGFYVEDTGPGISPDDRGEIFEIGYSTRPESTGFGLSIVKRIVNAHGWSVRVTAGKAGGARFEITGVEFVVDEPLA